MSIASEIARLQAAKEALKIAINDKGQNITDEKLDAYASFVDNISAVVELTQAQYDALPAYDNNTYYLIVEE